MAIIWEFLRIRYDHIIGLGCYKLFTRMLNVCYKPRRSLPLEKAGKSNHSALAADAE